METSVVTWILIAISFTTYFTINTVYKRLGVNTLRTALLATNGLRFLNLKHLLGIILFGVIFYVIFPEYRGLVEVIEIPRLHILIPFIVILLLGAYLSRVSFKKENFGCTNINDYSTVGVWTYLTLRFAFLLCFEFFFRGILLFKILEFERPIFAIISSTFLYVLVYVFDAQKKFFRAISSGILLCVFSYLTKSIWYPYLIHLTFSAVYEISMFYDLSFKKSTCDSK